MPDERTEANECERRLGGRGGRRGAEERRVPSRVSRPRVPRVRGSSAWGCAASQRACGEAVGGRAEFVRSSPVPLFARTRAISGSGGEEGTHARGASVLRGACWRDAPAACPPKGGWRCWRRSSGGGQRHSRWSRRGAGCLRAAGGCSGSEAGCGGRRRGLVVMGRREPPHQRRSGRGSSRRPPPRRTRRCGRSACGQTRGLRAAAPGRGEFSPGAPPARGEEGGGCWHRTTPNRELLDVAVPVEGVRVRRPVALEAAGAVPQVRPLRGGRRRGQRREEPFVGLSTKEGAGVKVSSTNGLGEAPQRQRDMRRGFAHCQTSRLSCRCESRTRRSGSCRQGSESSRTSRSAGSVPSISSMSYSNSSSWLSYDAIASSLSRFPAIWKPQPEGHLREKQAHQVVGARG